MLDTVIDGLATVVDPESGKNILHLGYVRDLDVSESRVALTIFLKNPMSPFASVVRNQVEDVLRPLVGASGSIDIELDNAMIDLGSNVVAGESRARSGSGILNTVAVASGKGGVGKSTVAVNLAIALASEGYAVGLVDTDIYGPSIPTMFGLEGARPTVNENRQIMPLEKYGVKLLSMGFLVDPMKAVVWRGPMVSGAVKQFLDETEWGELDFLVLDLPPGTGDIQLTIVQTVALSGAVIVSTPQKVALADARKGAAMFEQVNVPVLGIIENMAYFTPEELPDKQYYIFGKGGARKLANELEIPLLAELPIDPALRESCDRGEPLASMEGGSPEFSELARSLVRQIWVRKATRPETEKIEIVRR